MGGVEPALMWAHHHGPRISRNSGVPRIRCGTFLQRGQESRERVVTGVPDFRL